MMAPREVLRYVVIHELAHLRESSHDASFWSLVADFDPQYETHARWLKTNGTELVFSNEDF
jgi:predicted metal-dependent hydrolase